MKKILLIGLFSMILGGVQAKEVLSFSPNHRLKVKMDVKEQVSMQVWEDERLLMEVKNVCMEARHGVIPSRNVKLISTERTQKNGVITPDVKEKGAKIVENYNESLFTFSDKTQIQLRLFDNGIAYRFITNLKEELTVLDEHAEFLFDKSSVLTWQEDDDMNSDYEAPYVTREWNDIKLGMTGNCPALVKMPWGTNVLFLESNVEDYPCLWLKKSEQGLESHFWKYPKTYNEQGNSYNRRRVITTEDYIARTRGQREFPWRILAIEKNDIDLMTNQLVYILAPECRVDDTSWIKTGWVTFDWWARRGLYGVDFKAGVNTETAKYMIDFASHFGIPYFLFDDGWTYQEDLTRSVDGLDIPEVVKYARSKQVDVMLWVTYDLMDSQMDKAFKKFAEWGIKGLKIDFINRSDQEACNFYWKVAELAAQHKMIVDFHGAYRPDGLRRAYPNVLTRKKKKKKKKTVAN